MERPTVVLKIGTSSIVSAGGTVQVSALARLAEVTVRLFASDYNVIIVSSGAVGLGCARLGLKDRPTTVAGKQAAAAVGQVRLMTMYDDTFSILGRPCAQVLLTYDSFGERNQYLNARNTLLELLRLGIVPIVNENDSVATQELRVGDNDSLSAHVAAMVGATWLFLLTDVPALYEANPKHDPTAAPLHLVPTYAIQRLRLQMQHGAPRLSIVAASASSSEASSSSTAEDVAGQACFAAGGSGGTSAPLQGAAGSQWGTGGMQTKLKAAELATAAGVTVVIMSTARIEAVEETLKEGASTTAILACGSPPLSPPRAAVTATAAVGAPCPTAGSSLALKSRCAFADRSIGTTFLPAQRPVTGRKRWILTLVPQGSITIDAGAVAAVGEQRKSLFPAGILSVDGSFDAQDAVILRSQDGLELARALCNFSSVDLRKIAGRQSKDTSELLGYLGAEAVADRDNICVLLRSSKIVSGGASETEDHAVPRQTLP